MDSQFFVGSPPPGRVRDGRSLSLRKGTVLRVLCTSLTMPEVLVHGQEALPFKENPLKGRAVLVSKGFPRALSTFPLLFF